MSDILRQLVRTMLLEYQLRPGQRVYHRSSEMFSVGDELTPRSTEADARAARFAYEQTLETYRAKHHPELPSRLNCVYGSLVERSRFIEKGKLYIVEPVGATHVTDSAIVDELGARGLTNAQKRQLCAEYWGKHVPSRENHRDLEVLMERARVVEVVDESELRSGVTVAFASDAPTFAVELNVWGTKPSEFSVSAGPKMKDLVSLAVAREALENAGAHAEFRKSDKKLYVELGPGFTGVITWYSTKVGEKSNRPPVITLSTDRDGPSIRLDGYDSKEFIEAYRSGEITSR